MFLKNKNIIFKIRRSKVTEYAALNVVFCCHTNLFCRLTRVLVFLILCVIVWSMIVVFHGYTYLF